MKAQAAAAFQQAVLLQQQGRPFQADALCAEVLRVDPRHYGAWHLRAMLALEGGNVADGIEWLKRSLKLQPKQHAAYSNLGNALLSKGLPREALASFESALRLKPDYVAALYNKGNALRELKRLEEALTTYDKVLQLQPDHAAALNNRTLVLQEEVAALCAQGDQLQNQNQLAAALREYERALQIAPDSLAVLVNSGNALLRLGRPDLAITRYDHALQVGPDSVETLINRASALQDLNRHEEAAESFAAALRVAPERDYVLGSLLHARLDACDWRDYDALVAQIKHSLSSGKKVVNPLTLLALPVHPSVALAFNRSLAPPEFLRVGGPRKSHERIRVAYVSPDFREHPVSYLMAGVLERHDRQRFEVLGISLKAAQQNGIGARVRLACDQFVEVGERTDQEIATLLREMEVDIAVDLAGLTDGFRAGIFANRAAPVQVNYLGYPGTTGAPFMDYILGDEFVIPPESRQYYAENVVYLPECFQANDDRCEIAPKPTRASVGLPEGAFVFCCINNNYKLNPPVFAVWMRLLQATPNSVLWLLADRPSTQANLRREAAARGINEERLVFAARMPYARHLGRLGLADLFLDTLPYNAGATASDALRVGVPVLTCAGEQFVSRMAGSLLQSLGLQELITFDLQAYERKGLELARTPELLQACKARLAGPVFDTARFCRQLEKAYLAMHERAARGAPPESFRVDAGQ
jgi:protein O-GlcNAc transferase